MLAGDAQPYHQFPARNRGSSRTRDSYLDLRNIFTDYFETVYQCCARDDGGAMLIIMKYGDIQHLLESLFNIETLRSFNIFQVNSPKSRGDGSSNRDYFIRVVCVYFN